MQISGKHLFFIWLMLVAGLALLARLLDLQLFSHDLWSARAQENRAFASRIPRGRGVITDRYNSPLVVNASQYWQLKDEKALFGETTLISPEEGKQLMATSPASLVTTVRRWYPLGEALSPLMGYVGGVSAEDLKQDRDLSATDFVGKQGLEKTLDKQLRMAKTSATYEVTARGEKQRLISFPEDQTSAVIQTTIDPYLSAVAYEALGDNKGSVVIADVKTGAILALVSKPAFDNNLIGMQFADPVLEKERKEKVNSMLNSSDKMFFNRAISGAYPPGSIFKLVTALAALHSGNVTEATEVLDEGVLKVGEFSYANWYFTQYGRTEGPIRLRKAIARSNDIYFYKIAEMTGPQAIANMARVVGLGKPLGLGLAGEVGGLVPDPQWKESVKGERWFLGNTYHYGIGQGDLLITPVQAAQLTQTLLNGGVKCELHLLNSERLNCENLGVPEKPLELVLAGMEDACSAGGTGYPFFEWNTMLRQEGLSFKEQLANGAVACKTGTAEFGGTDERGYKKTHGWFVMGIGVGAMLREKLADSTLKPVEELTDQTTLADSRTKEASKSAELVPNVINQYLDNQVWLEKVRTSGFPETLAIAVLVESDEASPYREGSRDAAPIAKKIVEWMVK